MVGRSKYFKICPIHHTIGSPCNLANLSARSSGTANGKNGGLGEMESMIGSVITCVEGLPRIDNFSINNVLLVNIKTVYIR